MFKSELQFGLNHYSRQKVLSEKDSIVQVFANLLFMRPGQMPSMPHLGININKYLHEFKDNIDLTVLKNDIANQCAELLPYVNLDAMQVDVFDYQGAPTMFLRIPSFISKEEILMMGITKESSGRVLFDYKYDEATLI